MTKRKYPMLSGLRQVALAPRVLSVPCPNCGKEFRPRGLGKHYKECVAGKGDIDGVLRRMKEKYL